MIFRPKIFISSPFKDNENIRKNIQDFFCSVGAEPLLYESILTPSTIPMTHRNNIKDADFVIFIIKNNYGTKTDWNISGTHEEYIIAKNDKIPMHVYLINNATNENPLIDILKKDQISYYQFTDDENLFNRLKETTFTIAKEIMLNQIVKNNLPKKSIAKLSGNLDYNVAMEIIKIIESMKMCNIRYNLDWLDTDLFMTCIEPIIMDFNSSQHKFLNWKLGELLENTLSIAQCIIDNHVLDYTSIGGHSMEYPIEVLGTVTVLRLSYHKNTSMSREDYILKLKEFFNKYDEFKHCIQELRTLTDLI